MNKILLTLLLLPLGLFSKDFVTDSKDISSITVDFKDQTQNATIVFNHPAITAYTKFEKTINDKGEVYLDVQISEKCNINVFIYFIYSLSHLPFASALNAQVTTIIKDGSYTAENILSMADIDFQKNINMEELTYRVGHNTLTITIPIEA